MPPANFSLRPRSARRFIPPILVGVLVIAAVLVYIGTRGATTKVPPQPAASVAAFSLTDAGFTPYFEGKRASGALQTTDRSVIATMFTDYYRAAFVDPAKWKDPTFKAQAALFTADAQTSFARDLSSLTIGEGRTEFARVDPSSATIKTSVYYDKNASASWAVAVVTFRATATTNDHRTVLVVQNGTFRLRKAGAGWAIFSYDAKQSQDTPTPSPTASATGSAT